MAFQDSCYQLHTARETRTEAEEACKPLGHLVDITSIKEDDFILKLLYKSDTEDAWFGLVKTDVWSDGTPLVPMDWHDIIADGGDTCFRLDKIDDYYRWNDSSCDEEYHCLCERNGKYKQSVIRNADILI